MNSSLTRLAREFLDRAARLWGAAETAAKDNAQYSYNVRMSALPIRYIQCLKYAKTVNLTDDPKSSVGYCWPRCGRLGVQ